MGGVKWSDAEDALISKLISEGYSSTEILPKLKGRTISGLKRRIFLLGVMEKPHQTKKSEKLQTGKPKGTFKRGDPHPKYPELVFSNWNFRNNSEYWVTELQLKKMRENAAKRVKNLTNIEITRRQKYAQNYSKSAYEKIKKNPTLLSEKRENNRIWANSNKGKETQKKYFSANKNEIYARRKEWIEETKPKRKQVQEKYYQKNRKRINAKARERQNKRTQNDTEFVLSRLVRRRIYMGVKRHNVKKWEKSINLLGCTYTELRKHLESQFKLGMTWDNLGRGGWHIDHIIPLNCFNLNKPSHQKVCFNWQNLQPLWEKDNILKSDKLDIIIIIVILKNNYKTITI